MDKWEFSLSRLEANAQPAQVSQSVPSFNTHTKLILKLICPDIVGVPTIYSVRPSDELKDRKATFRTVHHPI